MIVERSFETLVQATLACPRCHGPVVCQADRVMCGSCPFVGLLRDGVAVMSDGMLPSNFDHNYRVMEHGSKEDGVHGLCYKLQAETVQLHLRENSVVLDVGCGPTLPYARPENCTLIGLEASFASVRANRDVDLRVYGTAARLPLPDSSVDTILCFYSIHHMVGATQAETRCIVKRALSEFERVMRPGGDLMIFEVSPWLPFWLAEQAAWNPVRHFLKPKFDVHFWAPGSLMGLAGPLLRRGTFRETVYPGRYGTTLPPAFGLPWFRVPRFLYPFDVRLYHWRCRQKSDQKLVRCRSC